MKTQRLIPSMFHRRLALLVIFFLIGGAGLAARVGRLTIIDHEALLREAERRLESSRWIETTRGRILDRRGRVLATDRPAFDIAVDYRVITGEWAVIEAARSARRSAGDRWAELSPAQRDALIDAALPEFTAELEGLWADFAATAGLTRVEVEERRSAIIADVQRTANSIWERRRLARQEELSRQRETFVEATLADVARPIREQRTPHVLLRGVDDRVAFAFRKLAERRPGLHVNDGVARAHPFDVVEAVIDLSTFPANLRQPGERSVTVRGAVAGIVGWTRDKVFEEDITRRQEATDLNPADDPGRYLPGDTVGSFGLEKQHELTLRGERGREGRRLDTGAIRRVEPKPGADLRLTIDLDLQTQILAALAPELGLTVVQDWHGNFTVPVGQNLAAGVAVVDVRTGETLALVSSQTFTQEELTTDAGRIFGDPVLAPAFHRAFDRPYEPGSIVKPLVLAAAVGAGAHSLGSRIECHGHLLPGRNDIYRCWIYRDRFGFVTHSQQVGGPLDAVEAIARSCNIYFYTLGRALGPDRLVAMYRDLGVGGKFGAGLEAAAPGFIGRLDGTPMEPTDAIFMGIGQGPVSWTPLHAASAYADLARGGRHIVPRLIDDGSMPVQRDLGWNKAAIDEALAGLKKGVNDTVGTGHHYVLPTGQQRIFNVPGVRIAGKTGTAQAGPIFGDAPEGSARPVLRSGDHAWTVVLAGPENGPYTHAVAVVVEYGGSGGRVAGPIANQAIHALKRLGYFDGVSP